MNILYEELRMKLMNNKNIKHMKFNIIKSLFKPLLVFMLLGVYLNSCYDSDDHQPIGDAYILSFSINGNVAVINEETKDIVVYLPIGTDVTALIPSIVVSMDATVTPNIKEPIDFSSPIDLTVVSKDGTKSNNYKVTIRNQENRIEKLEVIYNEVTYNAIINDAKNIITLYLPSLVTGLTNLKPIITHTDGAKVSLPSEYVDLSEGKEVLITVDYEGYKNLYRLMAQYAPAPEITKFEAGGVNGIINQKERTITMPFGIDEDISSLIPNITFSNELAEVIEPVEYQKGVDFNTSDLKFIISSDIGGVTTYRILVQRDLIINSFVIQSGGSSYSGAIDNDNYTINIMVPMSVDVTSLSPTITTNTAGANMQPASDTPQDFTNPIVYTISKGDVVAKYTVEVMKVDLKIGFLGVWSDADAIANDDEAAAYSWFKKTYPKGEYISFNDIKNGKDLSFFKVLWWHNDQHQKLPTIAIEGADELKKFYHSGRSLFLTTFATQYIKELGVSKDGLAPNSIGQNVEPLSHPWGNGLSVNNYEAHPIFKGLDIWDFGDGIKRFYLLFDNTWRMEKHSDWSIGNSPYATIDAWRLATGALDLGGYEWEAGRENGVTMAEFPKNNKGGGEGAVVCLGAISYDWHVDHQGLSDYVPNNFQDRIQILTQKTIDYLFVQ